MTNNTTTRQTVDEDGVPIGQTITGEERKALRAASQRRHEARAIFDQAIASTTDLEKIARLEIVREYSTNPTFRRALQDSTFAATQEARS